MKFYQQAQVLLLFFIFGFKESKKQKYPFYLLMNLMHFIIMIYPG